MSPTEEHPTSYRANPPPPKECETQAESLANAFIKSLEVSTSGLSVMRRSDIYTALQGITTRDDLENESPVNFGLLIALMKYERQHGEISDECLFTALDKVILHFGSIHPEPDIDVPSMQGPGIEMPSMQELAERLQNVLIFTIQKWLKANDLRIEDIPALFKKIGSYDQLKQRTGRSYFLKKLLLECDRFLDEYGEGPHMDFGILKTKLHFCSKPDLK